MTRRKAKKYIQEVRIEGANAQAVQNPPSIRKILTDCLKFVVSAATVLTLAAGVYALLSSLVSMSAGEPLGPDPQSAPFTLSNVSTFFTLTDVKPSCYINNIVMSGNVRERNSGSGPYVLPIPTLPPGQQDTIYCRDLLITHANPIGADVTLAVDYEVAVDCHYFLIPVPLITPHHSDYRFLTVHTSEGKLKWVPYGLHDQAPKF
jgi:hypothetical protein